MKKRMTSLRRRAVTLTELLVVLLIISLLATVAVPALLVKVRQSKIAIAWREVQAIAEAEKTVASIHQFFVPIHLLDDLNPAAKADGTVRVDDLDNSLLVPHMATDLLGAQFPWQNSLIRSGDPRLLKMYEEWAGPFLEPHRVFVIQESNPLGEASLRSDFPLDPWGQPYRFYSPRGLLGSGATTTNPKLWNSVSFDGREQTDKRRFDRYAIVSLGPDGTSPHFGGLPKTVDDDIVFQFAGQFFESSFRTFYH